MRASEPQVRAFFAKLYGTWGHQHWWPAESAFEVIVGAFLTQNTAWTNVERAIANLRAAEVLSLDGIRLITIGELEQLIRSSGYFRQKAQRLKAFVAYLDANYGGSLDRMFSEPTAKLREELLALNGVGPETADSILLYAGQHEVFPVDAYTRRILERHRMLPKSGRYEDIRQLFESAFTVAFAREALVPPEPKSAHKPAGAHHAPSPASTAARSERAQVFNEMHGLIVGVGKNYCQARRALCDECPLAAFLDKPVRLPKPARLAKKTQKSRK